MPSIKTFGLDQSAMTEEQKLQQQKDQQAFADYVKKNAEKHRQRAQEYAEKVKVAKLVEVMTRAANGD